MPNADFYGTVIMPMDHGKPRQYKYITKPNTLASHLAEAD